MPLTRDAIRESVERAGDEHWQALRDHHEDAYPNPKPTPGDVCKAEAARLNEMGLGGAPAVVEGLAAAVQFLEKRRARRASPRAGVDRQP